jgi:hypothetical protein
LTDSWLCLSLLRLPLIKQRASDEFHFEGDIADLLKLLAEMLVSINAEPTQICACQVR